MDCFVACAPLRKRSAFVAGDDVDARAMARDLIPSRRAAIPDWVLCGAAIPIGSRP